MVGARAPALSAGGVLNALLPEPGKRWATVFRDRLFWIGAGFVFLIHFNNYLAVWFPKFLVTFPPKLT